MENKRVQRLGMPVIMVIAVMAVLLTGGMKTFAEPGIAKVFSRPGQDVVWYVNGVEGDVIQTEDDQPTAMLGNNPCQVAASRVSDVEGVHFDTVIMLDNSLSISEPNRGKAKELIRQVIQNHTQDETFELYTFEKTLHQVASGSNYAALISAIDAVEFQNQDVYLIDCMTNLLQDLSQRDNYDYVRIILVSDGVDDNPLGYTYEELLEMIGDDKYKCPIYTVASIWEKDTSGLKNLQALSRKAGSETFVLDNVENVQDISSVLTSDYQAKCFLFGIPLTEKDGTTKNLNLSFHTTQGSYNLNHTVEIPNLTGEERQELERLQEEIAQEETEPITEAQTEKPETEKVTELTLMPVLVAEEETESEPPQEKEIPEEQKPPSFTDMIKSNLYLIIAGGVILLAVIILVILLISRKKKKSIWDDDQYIGSGYGGLSGQTGAGEEKTEASFMPGSSAEMTQDEHFDASGKSGSGTIGMWDSTGYSRTLILTDTSNPARKFEAQVRDEIIIGRDSLCTMVIADDRTVSSNHCKVSNYDGTLSVQDMNSHNGTYVNSERLQEKGMIIRSGDELKMGRSVMLVEIR